MLLQETMKWRETCSLDCCVVNDEELPVGLTVFGGLAILKMQDEISDFSSVKDAKIASDLSCFSNDFFLLVLYGDLSR